MKNHRKIARISAYLKRAGSGGEKVLSRDPLNITSARADIVDLSY
jgi:hypothetical protein